MKNLSKILVLLFCIGLSACGSQRVATSTPAPVAPVAKTSKSPFGETFTVPCPMYDDDEWFGATGIARGSYERMDVLQEMALTNAQNLCRQKMKHAYKGMVSDYAKYIGNNQGSNARTNIERAGDQVIDAIVNDTQSKCTEFSAVDDKGYVACYVGIKISKKEIADKIVDQISRDEEMGIGFEEDQYRKSMDKTFMKFKENKQ
ncbi:hypothetical protein [Bacteroides sp. 519]|uniref:hypothetical protein n=1 Tax=Bacteroides sp. 519 TaxID=2302937 RepID=UPI0013D68557|nr:hypothetical protein [Bacteroides sp. 519]